MDKMHIVPYDISIITSHQQDLVRSIVAHQDIVRAVRASGADIAADDTPCLASWQAQDKLWGRGYSLLEALGDGNVEVVSVACEVELVGSWSATTLVLAGKGGDSR